MKLLALVDSPDHVCCRYRIRAFESTLREAGVSLICESLARGVLARVRQLRSSSSYDAVILQRRLLPAWQLSLLRRHARLLAFDYDDAVQLRDSYDRRGIESSKRARRFARTVRTADAVIAGNRFLAECALTSGAPADRVQRIPTCVDPELYPVKQVDSHDGPLELVWIGSSSTLKGLEVRRPLWEKLGAVIPGLKLRVICDRFPTFENLEVVAVPWREATEAMELVRGDVGVGMIPDDDWSRGKCGLKILQYQAAGLPVIANPVGSHLEMVEPGETGFLAESDDQWIQAVQALASAATRARLGREARRRVEADFSVASWAPSFVKTATGGATPPSSPAGPLFKRDEHPQTSSRIRESSRTARDGLLFSGGRTGSTRIGIDP